MIHTLRTLRQKTVDDGNCWIWQGATAGKGYPVVRDDRERYAHRLVLMLSGREIGAGQQAAHRCGRALCINPDHIYAATQSENERDKDEHGTARRGVPGVTHCGRYIAGGRCKRVPHDGPCKPDIFEKTYEASDQIRISDGMIQRAREAMCAQTGHYPTITAAIEILSAALDGEQADREPSERQD